MARMNLVYIMIPITSTLEHNKVVIEKSKVEYFQ